MNFEINLIPLIKPFFQHDQRTLKGFQAKQLTQVFWGGESPTFIILLYVSLVLLNYKDFFIKNTHKKNTLQQVVGRKTLNLDLKKILELFLKIQRNIRISILKRKLQTRNEAHDWKLTR